MDGTEALTGDTGAAAPPPVDSSLAGSPDYQQQQADAATQQPAQQQPAAPPSGQTPDLGGSQPLSLPPASSPNVQEAKPSGLDRLFGAVADFLSPRDQQQTVIDDNGVRHTVEGKPLSRGQQIGHLIGHALEGAAIGAGAPAGPGHVAQGASAGTLAGMQRVQQQKALQEQQAEGDFARRQKAKVDNLNYQIGIRDLATKSFELTRRQVAATQEDQTFAQKQEDRERELGSFDLGKYTGAMDLHQVMEQQPDLFKRMDQRLITAVPTYDADGKRTGIHIFERKAQVGSQPAKDGTQFAVWTPGRKAGEQPHLEWRTAAAGSASNDDIDRWNMAAMNQAQGYAKEQADILDKQTTATKNLAEAKEAGARSVEAIANAGKANAEARKARIEANNESSQDGSATTPNEANAESMVEGRTAPSQLSKRSKDYNALLPLANAYSMKKYGVPFDAEVSEGRYKARVKAIEQFGNMEMGNPGNQIFTFNKFLAHADELSKTADQLRNTNSPLLNKPLKSLRVAMGDASYAKLAPTISAVRTEYQNFLNNAHALHEQDITEGKEMLSDNMSLAQMQQAIKTFGTTAVAQVGALNQQYRRVVGAGDVPDLLDPNSRATIQSLGLADYAQTALGSAWTQQPSTQQVVSSPPVPQQQQGQGQPQQQQQPQLTQDHAHAAVAAGVPVGARPGYDASGKLAGYMDGAGWHALGGK